MQLTPFHIEEYYEVGIFQGKTRSSFLSRDLRGRIFS